MKRKVYIETSIISYLAARPSNDPIKSVCQQITRLWWDAGRASVSAFISPYVVEEASTGDSIAAGERIEWCVLAVGKAIASLASSGYTLPIVQFKRGV